MFYITTHQSPRYHQMTLEELLFQEFDPAKYQGIAKPDYIVFDTRTYMAKNISPKLREAVSVPDLVERLRQFNTQYEPLFKADRASLYETFHIPKRSGGLRRIDAPKPELMEALRVLKGILEHDFHALYHTSAFAYIKKRSTISAVKRHQNNQSRWFAKLDLHDFFGSTTMEFVMQQLSVIYPFCMVVETKQGREALETAMSLAFLNGGLPQGTPISPLITNLMMIPLDFKLFNKFRNFDGQTFVYTRYADDFLISSQKDFDMKKVEEFVLSVLSEFSAPFSLNVKKSRYGSSAGRNWNLGVMLNKDNQITVGNAKKKQFQSMLHNYVRDRRAGTPWELGDIQTMQGYYSYYKMVEGETIDKIVQHMNAKLNADILSMIREDLTA